MALESGWSARAVRPHSRPQFCSLGRKGDARGDGTFQRSGRFGNVVAAAVVDGRCMAVESEVTASTVRPPSLPRWLPGRRDARGEVASQRSGRSTKSHVAAAAALDAGYMAVESGRSGPAVLALLCASAAAAQVLEDRTEIGARVSAPLLAMALGCCLAALRVLPSASAHAAAYDLIWEHLMPLAVSFSLLETDISQVYKSAGPSFGAFLLGALSTLIGTVAAFVAVGKWMGPEGWKVAACFCASYIGGSINYAATAQGLGLGASAGSRGLLAAGMSVDNLLMALFFSALAALPQHWETLLPGPHGSRRGEAPSRHTHGTPRHIDRGNSTGNSTGKSASNSEKESGADNPRSTSEFSSEGPLQSTWAASEHVGAGQEDSDTGDGGGTGEGGDRGAERETSHVRSEASVGPPPSRTVTVETLTVSIAAATAAFAVSGAICARQAGTKTARPQVAVIALLSSLLGVALPKLGLALRRLQLSIRTLLAPSRPPPRGDWAPAAHPSPSSSFPSPSPSPSPSSTSSSSSPPSPFPSPSTASPPSSPPPSLDPIRPLFSGSSLVSSALLLIFFATIGATANVHDAVAAGGPLFAFVSILLTVHLSLLLAVGKALKLPLDVLLVASNANVGGPATSAAMATSRGWQHLVQPAILTGTFGYAIGTPLGFFLASKILKPLAQRMVLGQ